MSHKCSVINLKNRRPLILDGISTDIPIRLCVLMYEYKPKKMKLKPVKTYYDKVVRELKERVLVSKCCNSSCYRDDYNSTVTFFERIDFNLKLLQIFG
mgnify:CR=1 FL=1